MVIMIKANFLLYLTRTWDFFASLDDPTRNLGHVASSREKTFKFGVMVMLGVIAHDDSFAAVACLSEVC